MKTSKLTKILFGEKTPDRNDPAYRDKYERGKKAGQRFARFVRLDNLFVKIQRFAEHHPKLFLGITFGFILFFFFNNIVLSMVSYSRQQDSASVVERQDSVLSIINNQVTE